MNTIILYKSWYLTCWKTFLAEERPPSRAQPTQERAFHMHSTRPGARARLSGPKHPAGATVCPAHQASKMIPTPSPHVLTPPCLSHASPRKGSSIVLSLAPAPLCLPTILLPPQVPPTHGPFSGTRENSKGIVNSSFPASLWLPPRAVHTTPCTGHRHPGVNGIARQRKGGAPRWS